MVVWVWKSYCRFRDGIDLVGSQRTNERVLWKVGRRFHAQSLTYWRETGENQVKSSLTYIVWRVLNYFVTIIGIVVPVHWTSSNTHSCCFGCLYVSVLPAQSNVLLGVHACMHVPQYGRLHCPVVLTG
jgi:hypothetical protein